MRRVFLLTVALSFVVGRSSDADPRWWQHDLMLIGPSGPKTWPDVATHDGFNIQPIVVVWEQADATSSDVWLTASFDGGCSWCEARPWAASAEDEGRPRVEVGVVGTSVSMQVVYEQQSQVWVSGAAIDLGIADPCAALAAEPLPTPVLLSRPLAAGDVDLDPRIADVSDGSYHHFHVTWQRAASGTSSLEYSNDLSGVGASWTTGIDVSTLIASAGTSPDVAATTVSDNPGVDSAVTLFFRGPSGEVMVTESSDAGVTWGPPVAVSASVTTSEPAADSSAQPFGDPEVWAGALWQEQDSPHDVAFDAGLWTAPSTRSPDFELPGDIPVSDLPNTPGIAPALSMTAADAQGYMYGYWTDVAPPLSEIVARSGFLDNFGPVPRDFTEPAFVPQRTAPADPTMSAVSPFSNCSWDDDWPALATASCATVARIAGAVGADRIASADRIGTAGLPADFFAVFADDRSGEPEIYFKRTDGGVAAPLIFGAATNCPAPFSPSVDIEIALIDECPTAPPERIERYLLYYGSVDSQVPPASLSGPFLSRFDQPNTGATMFTVPGLASGELYQMWLVAEDEARNIAPADFDPRVDTNVPISIGQRRTVLVRFCDPDVVFYDECSFIEAYCELGEVPDTDPPHPGETVEVVVLLENIGDMDASNLTGTIVATNATVIDPPGGDLSLLSLTVIAQLGLPLGIPVTLRIPDTTTCPASINVSLENLASDGGLETYDDLVCTPPVIDIDCTSTCIPTGGCLTSFLTTPPRLQGIKELPDSARFSWVFDPNAAEYHLNAVTMKQQINDTEPHLPPAPGIGDPRCTSTAPTTECVDPNAINDPSDRLFYQVFSACGPLGTDEGPF